MDHEIAAWIEGATFENATPEQVRDLIGVFEMRAERPLSDEELGACFQLRHRITCSQACLEGVLLGKIRVVGEDELGQFIYAAAPDKGSD